MDFLASAIVGGIIYDVLKAGVSKLTMGTVFERIYCSDIDKQKCQQFLDEINSIPDMTDKIVYTRNILCAENEYTTFFERSLYKTNFAKRLDYVLSLVNNTDYYGKKLNVESLGEFLGLKSVNELKKCYITAEEPTYEFMEMVAEKLGISSAWMKAGEGNIFKSNLKRMHRATELFREEDYDEIKEFVFAMLDVPYERQIILVRRMNEVKYEYYPRPFIFYCSGGVDGASELLSVYEMLKKLNEENKVPSAVYLLKEEKFNQLLAGKMYPGAIKREKYKSYILDDFICLNDGRISQFEEWYGRTFIDAQNCVANRLGLR